MISGPRAGVRLGRSLSMGCPSDLVVALTPRVNPPINTAVVGVNDA